MKFLRRAVRYLGIAALAAIVGFNIWQIAARSLFGQELPVPYCSVIRLWPSCLAVWNRLFQREIY